MRRTTRSVLAVTALAVPHKGGRTFGYRLTDDDGTVVYVPDHLPAGGGPERDAVIGLLDGADLLIHDSQFVTSELRLADDYGHSTIDQATSLAVEAGVAELVLFHHAPGRTDAQLDRIHDELDHRRLRGLGTTVRLGCEGDEFSVGTGRQRSAAQTAEVVARPAR